MNEIDELSTLEDELGSALRRCLDGMLGNGHIAIRPADPADAEHRPATLLDAQSLRPTSERPLSWLLPAAAVLVVGAVGALVWSGSSATGFPPNVSVRDEPLPVPTMEPATTEAAAPTPFGASTTTIMPEGLDGFVWVPTVEPAGYGLTSVDVTTGGPVLDRPAGRYLRRGTDGVTVDAWVEVSAAPVRKGDAPDESPDARVHDLPATLIEVQPGMLELSWQEGGLRANVRAAGVDRDTVLQIAETTIIDVRALGLRLEGAPSGFEESPGVAIAPDDAPTTSYSWLPTDGRAGMFVNAGARPNTGLHTLDSLQATAQAPGWESSRIQLDRPGVGLLPAWVATSSANEFGRLIAITWIEGPFVLSVSGRLGLDDLQDIAEGFASADLAAVRTFRERVDAAALELPELDAAETPSGVGISVHTTGTGANVVCVRTPFARCQYTTSESSLVGDRQTAVVQTFHVDGATRVIGWAEGEHTPQLVIGDRLEPITDTARSGVGTFFVVLDPDEAAQFVFDAGDQTTGPMFGGAMTPYGATPVVVLV